MGKPCIMGRKTYEEIGKPLKGRINIVVSRKHHFNDVINASSYEDALGIAENYTDNEIMVIGGGEIYKEAIKTADAMILTVFDTVFDGDVFFPSFHQVDAFLPIDDDTPHLREDMWKHNLFTTWDGTRIYRCDRVMKGVRK
jgi:dihydrofolate reductase